MRIGAHVDSADPLTQAATRNAEVVQFFLTDPKNWSTPEPRPDAESLRGSAVEIFIHSPYVINVATTNNRIRIPSRKLLLAHARVAADIGARGLVVHGGHVSQGDDIAIGIDNWRKTFTYAAENGGFPLPILIENTAGGDQSVARRFDTLARLWDAIGEYGAGFCLDTCHAHAAGEDLVGIVDRVKAITGRIDLIHANDSRDPFDSGRDRHANLGQGEVDPALIVEVLRASGAPAVVETPTAAQAADIALLRAGLAQ